MKVIEIIKNNLLGKDKITKQEFISSINYLYSVNKITISETENDKPTLLKILNLIEEHGKCWDDIIIDEEKTNCIYNEEEKNFTISISVKQKEDNPIYIVLQNRTGMYSNLSCEEIQKVFNYAFLGNADKDFIENIKKKIERS